MADRPERRGGEGDPGRANPKLAVGRASPGKNRGVVIHSCVSRPGVPLQVLELAGLLRSSNPKEAVSIYQQIKKEFPDTTIADQADRGLDTLSPKS